MDADANQFQSAAVSDSDAVMSSAMHDHRGLEDKIGEALGTVVGRGFGFRATDYYSGLIDWWDKADPIRRLIVPGQAEERPFGSRDASNEASNTVAPGLQHKYRDTALMLVTDRCAGFCRYCFRKRLFSGDRDQTMRDTRPAVEYIGAHPEITDVLLSGGDPLTLPTHTLRDIIEPLLAMPHVRTIRVGSKMPAFDPVRISQDPELAALVDRIVTAGRSFYLMCHFDHARELTKEAVSALRSIRDAGGMCLNQCPITRGINDNAQALADLFQACTEAGAPQYYVFQCRPAIGNSGFVMPITKALSIVEQARDRVSGLSRRARFCMSCETGKIEFVGMDAAHLYARFHRAKAADDAGRFVLYRRDDRAMWLSDLQESGA